MIRVTTGLLNCVSLLAEGQRQRMEVTPSKRHDKSRTKAGVMASGNALI